LIEFGIWGYVSTTINYLALIDPGFGLFVNRYAARARTPNERTLVRRVATFGVCAWFVILSALSPIVLLGAPILVHHLHLNSPEQHAALTVFFWGYFYFFVSVASGTIGQILIGIGALWLNSIIDFGTRVVYGVLAVILLIDGFGIWALIIASTSQVLLATTATWVAIRRHFGPVLGNPLRIERSVLRELARSGGWFQIATVAYALNTDTDPLVIGTFVNAPDVGIYNVANKLAVQANYLPGVLQRALFPAIASSRPEDNDHDQTLRTAAINGNRLTSLFSFAVGAAIVGLSPVVYRAWLGRLYPGVDTATAILVIAGLAAAVGTTVGTLLFATGQISLAAKITAAGVGANLALTLALVVPLGMTGVLIGTVAANVTAMLVGTTVLNRRLAISWRDSVWTWLWRLLIAAGLAAGSCRLVLVALPPSWQDGRGTAFGTLCLLGALYAIMLLLGLRLTRFFHDDDITLVREVVPGPLGRLAGWRPVLWLAGGPR